MRKKILLFLLCTCTTLSVCGCNSNHMKILNENTEILHAGNITTLADKAAAGRAVRNLDVDTGYDTKTVSLACLGKSIDVQVPDCTIDGFLSCQCNLIGEDGVYSGLDLYNPVKSQEGANGKVTSYWNLPESDIGRIAVTMEDGSRIGCSTEDSVTVVYSVETDEYCKNLNVVSGNKINYKGRVWHELPGDGLSRVVYTKVSSDFWVCCNITYESVYGDGISDTDLEEFMDKVNFPNNAAE